MNMKYFFYNSYSQGKGFKILEKSDNDSLFEPSTVPSDISNDFINGGISIALRPSSDKKNAFLLVKGIEEVNNKKKFDEPGRKIFINFALMGDLTEFDKLTHVCVSILSNWKNFCHYFIDMFIVDYADTFGYRINSDKWNAMLNYLYTYNTNYIANPKLRKIESEKETDKARLMVFVRDLKYYNEQNDLLNEMAKNATNPTSILNMIENDELNTLTEEEQISYEDFKLQIERTCYEKYPDNISKKENGVISTPVPVFNRSYHPLWIAIAFLIGIFVGIIICYYI